MWERERDIEDEEEAHERRKLEKKLREKEAAYQEVKHINKCNVLFYHLMCDACVGLFS